MYHVVNSQHWACSHTLLLLLLGWRLHGCLLCWRHAGLHLCRHFLRPASRDEVIESSSLYFSPLCSMPATAWLSSGSCSAKHELGRHVRGKGWVKEFKGKRKQAKHGWEDKRVNCLENGIRSSVLFHKTSKIKILCVNLMPMKPMKR